MARSEAASLMLQAEKVLPQPIRPDLLAYCPNMDLIAVITDDDTLDVYRLNGQRAFTRKRRKGDSFVSALAWQHNGKAVILAWSDLKVESIDAETGKEMAIVNWALTDGQAKSLHILSLSSSSIYIDIRAVKAKVGSHTDPVKTADQSTDVWDSSVDRIALNDVLQGHLDLQVLDPTPELPDQIALLDVERVLPRLPVLTAPAAGPLGRQVLTIFAAFTVQSNLDHMFHAHHLEYANALNPLLLCHADGKIGYTIHASLNAQQAEMPFELDATRPKISHTVHPYSRSHCFLMERKWVQKPGRAASRYGLSITSLTFRFIALAGRQVHLVGNKLEQLLNLSYYIFESVRALGAHWYQSQDLPSKFIRNINETLKENGEGDFVQNLYHLAATGHCPPDIKEWLTEELTESGHKRWDHAVTQGYVKILEIAHENLIPAIDRASMVASLLRGHATFDDSQTIFNITIQQLSNILTTLKSLRLLAQNVLIIAAEDRRQFVAFSKWLRLEIDNQASESTSAQAAEDAADRAAGIDYAQLLQYIQGPMSGGRLDRLLRRQMEVDKYSQSWSEDIEETAPPYEDVCKAIAAFKNGLAPKGELIDAYAYVARLRSQCGGALRRASKWQNSNTKWLNVLMLEKMAMSEVRDIRMLNEEEDETRLSTYVAVVPLDGANHVYLHRILHCNVYENAITDTYSVSNIILELPPKFAVTDLKFVDDDHLMLLAKADDTSYLLSLTYTTRTPSSPSSLAYDVVPDGPNAYPPEISERPKRVLNTLELLKPYVRHVFPSTDLFKPLRIEVNGRKHRRVVCVVSEDKRHYRVYDLDFQEGWGEKRGGGVGAARKVGGDSEEDEDESEDEDVEMEG